MTTPEEQEKLDHLYHIYEQPMYRIAYAILHHTQQAEDAVSDAFLRIIQNLRKIDAVDSEQTKRYIVRIIRSTAINQYRKNQKESARWTTWDDKIMQIPDKSDDIEQLLTNVIQEEAIATLLEPLGETDKQIVLMRCQEELSFREIASQLAIQEAAARKRFERAKKTIRKQREDMYYEAQLFSL